MVFGEVLRELRNNMGLTQAELASELSLSRAAVAGYENSGKEPTFEVLIRVAKYFGVTTDYILGLKQQSKEEHKMDFKLALDDAIGDSQFVKDEHGEAVLDGFSALLYETLEDAIKAGVEKDIAKLLVATTKAVKEMATDVKVSSAWVPDDYYAYDLDGDSYNTPDSIYSQSNTVVQYSRDTIGKIRANQFRARVQGEISSLTESVDDFVSKTYTQLQSGKLPKKRGAVSGNSNKKGK